jgi:hypothetical protein
MSKFPIDVALIQNAEDACKSSRERFAAGDRTVTPDELAAYGALLADAKACGVNDPFAELVLEAMPEKLHHWANRGSPLNGRRLTPKT